MSLLNNNALHASDFAARRALMTRVVSAITTDEIEALRAVGISGSARHRCVEYCAKNGVSPVWYAEMLDYLNKIQSERHYATRHLYSCLYDYCSECGIKEGHTSDCLLYRVCERGVDDGWTPFSQGNIEPTAITYSRQRVQMQYAEENGAIVGLHPWLLPDLRAQNRYRKRRRRARLGAGH